jgi:thiamine-phosphate pyrophosphorylase
LYAILDTGLLARNGIAFAEAIEGLLEAGVQLVQFRHKEHFGAEAFEWAHQAAAACAAAGATFIVNDRADMALLLGASGVHVGQEDLPPQAVRALIGARMIGLSTHNERQFRAAASEPVDYIAIGPIFETTTKLKADPVVGVDELARLRPITEKAVVAIGGINRETAPRVYAAGADSIALCSDLFPRGGSRADVRERALEWLRL